MNNLKRFLALALVLSMVLTAVPFGAFATESTDQTEVPAESVTEAPESDVAVLADDGLATTALTLGTKPENGTVTGEPFNTSVSKNYRIPGLVNHNGTLIASADARWDYEKDGGGMDLVVSRSADGKTWNYTFAGYLGDNGNVWNANSSTLMDPVIISDGSTLYLLADMFPAGYSLSTGNTTNAFSDTATGFDGSGNLLLSNDGRNNYGHYLKDGKILTAAGADTGYSVQGWYDLYQNGTYVTNLFFSDSPFQVHPTSYICMSTSTDGGENWSNPVLVNAKPSGVAWMVLGPGSGLALDSGDIAFTAYDGSNIYLIWGNAINGWNRISTNAATNESSIIELNDGTIRAFVKRGGSNTIAYVDFTKNANGGYTAGSLVDTKVTNFSQCMVSSLHYSKTLNDQEVVLVCCPSKPGSGDWNGRFNGKIHMFTLDDSNNMTLENSYALNGVSEFFAYSNMAEMDDGTIGVLYEDDCISYSAGGYTGDASHITYTNVNLETAFDVTFDVPVADTIMTDDTTKVQVGVSDTDTSAWNLVVTPDQTVAALNGAEYVAYDVTITKADGSKYEDPAEVTLPLGKMAGKTSIYPFVIEDDGTVSRISKFTVDADSITFTAPHFSVLGIAEDASNVTETKDVTLYVGNSTTITDNTGNYESTYTGAGLNESIAKVEVDGTTVEDSVVVTPLTSLTAGTANTFYIQVSEGTYLTDDVGTTTNINEAALWYAYYAGYSYCTIRNVNTTYYLSVGYDGNVTTTQGVSYMKMSDGKLVGYYSNNAAGTPVKVSGAEAVNKTDITITGVSAGNTSVVVGSTKYNITVQNEVRDIVLYTGKSKTDIIENADYTNADVTVTPNTAVATLDKVEGSTVVTEKGLREVSSIESGKQYLLVNIRANKTLTNQTNDVGLLMDGAASADSTHLWTIEGSGDYYTVRYGTSGGYLNVGYGTASVTESEVTLQLDYIENSGHWLINDQQGWYGLNDYGGNKTTAAGWGDAATDDGSWWKIYEIVEANTTNTTEVTFTGVKAGTTTATIGRVKYNITVQDAPVAGDISDFNNIVGVDQYTDDNSNATYRSDLDMAGKKITSLRITEGASFHLGVDVTEYESVVWSSDNPSVATVDQDGNVTAVANAVPDGAYSIEAHVTATVIKNGVEESITIPVTVVPSMVEGAAATQFIFYYIEQVDETDPYYTMFLSSESTTSYVPGHHLVKVSEGEVIWYERPANTAFAWVWTADPWEGYALTKMGSSGSIDEYYPLRDVNDITKLGDGYVDTDGNGSFTAGTDSEYYYTSASFSTNGAPNNAYKNVVLVGNDGGASWKSALNSLLGEAIVVGQDTWANYGCDGAMSNTRWDHDGVPNLVTAMTFISDPMPHIEKSVNGILPTTKLRADFENYHDGMTATVGEFVYFEITITLDRPTVWADEDAGIGAITYSAAEVLDDDLPEGYFYVQAADTNLNGVLDGNEEGQNKQLMDITEQLNAAWGTNEQTRTIKLYLVYEIQEDDIPKFVIDNTADLTWNYQSHYSTGKLSGKANAQASIVVVGYAMDNVVIDFGQTIVYDGLTDAELKYVSVGDNADVEAKYGTVKVEGVGDVHNTTTNIQGSYYDQYKVTYTPTAILQEPDVVKLYGTYIDTDGTNDIPDGTEVRKMINSFVVYPATTVHYEEGFLFNASSTGWDLGSAVKATEEQTFEHLRKSVYNDDKTLVGYKSDKTYAYGYDPCYDDNIGASNGSQATANTAGANTSFTFTGTGFDLYANCDETTGYVSVQVKNNSTGKVVKMYTVNTVVKEEMLGTGDATDGQQGSMYSLPIVSEQGLAHGNYTVTIRKIMSGTTNADGTVKGVVHIDGVRIFNTIDESPYATGEINAESLYAIDLEDLPEFYELRDYVLDALAITDETSADYGTLEEMAGQVYQQVSSDSEAPAVILADCSGEYTDKTKEEVQNLLDNGPKNELYLHAGETLVFKVSTKRAMQIGLKAPAGKTSYSISGATNTAVSGTMNSSVDMFYELDNAIGTQNTYTITISNTGSNILSVTDLKICDDPTAAFAALTEKDIETALIAMGYGDPCAEGHSYEAVVTDPTCTEAGYTTYTCTVCGDSYVGDETAALGHSYDAVVTAPSCTEAGYTTYTCTVCGDSYVGDETEALGHSHEAVVTDPTCTEQGYTTYTCHCGDTYVDNYVDATGHDYSNGSCSDCGEKDPNYSGSSNTIGQTIAKIIGWIVDLLKP